MRKKGKPLTPERLMHILNQIEVGERARKAYKALTGLNPPTEPGEVMTQEEQDDIKRIRRELLTVSKMLDPWVMEDT